MGVATSFRWILLLHKDVPIAARYSSMLSFMVNDINSTMTKLMSLSDELNSPLKLAMCCLDGHILGLYECI
ncbi:hypothetical protein K2173_022713 [Erythroxylum novogranatense]|uniref:Uncharacterized protein n=1 Tax=Erythroxylum novogranatense TaxID=1862640 RepID=A0AAV8TQW0_9ROSI|nr:hypothetical protein K2173_022713 [Erythroxylum novogranatense]